MHFGKFWSTSSLILSLPKHFGGIIWRCWGPWAEVSGTGGHAHSLLHPTDQSFSPGTVCLCVSSSCSFSQLAYYYGLGKAQIIHRWKNLEITAHLKSWQFYQKATPCLAHIGNKLFSLQEKFCRPNQTWWDQPCPPFSCLAHSCKKKRW